MDPLFDQYDRDPCTVARRLLGQRLVRREGRKRVAGTIVEVEAYLGAEDRAAHTFGGRRTARNASMYLAGGHAYVYFTYGMHHCMNVVCGGPDEGVAVLVRALAPSEGLAIMRRRRGGGRGGGGADDANLCSGPAKLTQALAIDRTLDGVDLRVRGAPLSIEAVRRRALPARRIVVAPRIGIDYAGDWARAPLRFYIDGDPNVSRRAPACRMQVVRAERV